MNPNKIVEALKKYNNFIITAHINLEGDAIGSVLAMKSLLDKLGKDSRIVVPEAVPEIYSKIRGIDAIGTEIPSDVKYDALVALDCTSAKRIENIAQYANENKLIIINVDHHASNMNFGDVNWVEPEASSAGEMLYDIFKAASIEIDMLAAEHLYIAIMTDTGSFRYTNTTPHVFRVAAELLEKGVDPAELYDALYSNRTLDNIRLLSKALGTIKVDPGGKIAWAVLDLPLLEGSGYNKGDLDGFIDYPRSIRDVEVAILFTQIAAGVVKVSMRSNTDLDVNKVASAFGGGGHIKASGCTLTGELNDIIERVIDETKRYFL
ncbi:MAG: hypothetical protein AUJ75_03955 [Candidatus Omnitrophica bacterium CG1_02_49_10]|nr:MAG: hypothetical protein AUJ75_03955 [Candidatus Omnitrophica bacterium CG1_02_49_10]